LHPADDLFDAINGVAAAPLSSIQKGKDTGPQGLWELQCCAELWFVVQLQT